MTDNTAPVLKRFVLSNTIDLSKGPVNLQVLAEADDGEGGSGIQYVSVWFDKQLDFADYRTSLLQFGSFKGDTFADATPTIGGDLVQLLDKTPSGTYTVSAVWVTDTAGNRAVYTTQQLQALGMSTTLTVTGRPVDLTGPVLKSLSMPASVDLSRGAAAVPFVVEASDNPGGSGMSDVAIWFRQPFASDGQSTDMVFLGSQYYGDGFGDATPERAARSMVFDPQTRPGTYEIARVLITDRSGNSTSYLESDLKALGIATAMTVTGGTDDRAAPELLDLWVPTTVSRHTGAPQTFAVRAKDDGGVLGRAFLNFDRTMTLKDSAGYGVLVGGLKEQDDFADATPQFGADSITLNAATETGTYQVQNLSLTDTAGNQRLISAAELQARGFNTSVTVTDRAPSASLAASLDGERLVLSLSSRDWQPIASDSFSATLHYDASRSGFAGAAVAGNGSDGVSLSYAVSGSGGMGRVTVTGRGPMPADGVLNIFLDPVGSPGVFQYAVSGFTVNAVPQAFDTDGAGSLRHGSAGADVLDTAHMRFIDGRGGVDQAVFGGMRADYMVDRKDGLVVVGRKDGQQVSLAAVERLKFADGAFAVDIEGTAGQAYRLYQAAFNRQPDEAGVGYWIGKLDAGASLDAVAQSFIWSREFESLYGANPSNDAFLAAVYRNVLHRAPDAEGYAYWLKALDGAIERPRLLVLFSESAENVAQVVGSIEHGFAYHP